MSSEYIKKQEVLTKVVEKYRELVPLIDKNEKETKALNRLEGSLKDSTFRTGDEKNNKILDDLRKRLNLKKHDKSKRPKLTQQDMVDVIFANLNEGNIYDGLKPDIDAFNQRIRNDKKKIFENLANQAESNCSIPPMQDEYCDLPGSSGQSAVHHQLKMQQQLQQQLQTRLKHQQDIYQAASSSHSHFSSYPVPDPPLSSATFSQEKPPNLLDRLEPSSTVQGNTADGLLMTSLRAGHNSQRQSETSPGSCNSMAQALFDSLVMSNNEEYIQDNGNSNQRQSESPPASNTPINYGVALAPLSSAPLHNEEEDIWDDDQFGISTPLQSNPNGSENNSDIGKNQRESGASTDGERYWTQNRDGFLFAESASHNPVAADPNAASTMSNIKAPLVCNQSSFTPLPPPADTIFTDKLGQELEGIKEELALHYPDLEYARMFWKDAGLYANDSMISIFNPNIIIEYQNLNDFSFNDFIYILTKDSKTSSLNLSAEFISSKSIILVGESGYGKSTLTHEITRMWKMGDANLREKFALVIFVRLEKVDENDVDFESFQSDLSNHPFFNKNKFHKMNKLLENYQLQSRTLFIFDNYDEYALGKSVVELDNIIGKKVFKYATTLVTAKSSTIEALKRVVHAKPYNSMEDKFGENYAVLNLHGFTDNGMKEQLKKFGLSDEHFDTISKSTVISSMLRVPLFLTIYSFIEKGKNCPRLIQLKSFEIFDLFYYYVKKLFDKTDLCFKIDERNDFLYTFSLLVKLKDQTFVRSKEVKNVNEIIDRAIKIRLLYKDSNHNIRLAVENVVNVIKRAKEVGLLYKDSNCNKRLEDGSHKVNLIFPHVLFKDYFTACCFGSMYEKGTIPFEEPNPQTYLSYFITGFSPKYRTNIFKNSFNPALDVLKISYIAHAEDLLPYEFSSKHHEYVIFKPPQSGGDEIILPSTVINRATFSPKCDLRITGAVLTDDIEPFSTVNGLVLYNCQIHHSFCTTLHKSEITSLSLISCSPMNCSTRKTVTSQRHVVLKNNLTCFNFQSNKLDVNWFNLLFNGNSTVQPDELYMQQLGTLSLPLSIAENHLLSLNGLGLFILQHLKITFCQFTLRTNLLQSLINKLTGVSTLRSLQFVGCSKNQASNDLSEEIPFSESIYSFGHQNLSVSMKFFDLFEISKLLEYCRFLMENGIHIQGLDIQLGNADVSTEFQEQLIASIKHFNSLEFLNIQGVSLSPDTLTNISKHCEENKTEKLGLPIDMNNFTDPHHLEAFFSSLRKNPFLKELYLRRCDLNRNSMNECYDLSEKFKDLNHLKNLTFSGVPSKLLTMITEKAFSNLEVLDLSTANFQNEPPDVLYKILSHLERLSFLKIDDQYLDFEHVYFLQKKLKEKKMIEQYKAFSSEWIEYKLLLSLKLNNIKIECSYYWMEIIKECESLKILHLVDCNLTYDAIHILSNALPSLNDLEEINFMGTFTSPYQIGRLSMVRSLKKLYINSLSDSESLCRRFDTQGGEEDMPNMSQDCTH